jgi:hypothetical protein
LENLVDPTAADEQKRIHTDEDGELDIAIVIHILVARVAATMFSRKFMIHVTVVNQPLKRKNKQLVVVVGVCPLGELSHFHTTVKIDFHRRPFLSIGKCYMRAEEGGPH